MRTPSGLMAVSVCGGDPARSTAEELGIGDAVLTAGPAEDARRLYAAADVLMLAEPRRGALPFAVLEALAGGLGWSCPTSPAMSYPVPSPEHGRRATRAAALAAATEELLERAPDVVERDALASRAWLSGSGACSPGPTGWSTSTRSLSRPERAASLRNARAEREQQPQLLLNWREPKKSAPATRSGPRTAHARAISICGRRGARSSLAALTRRRARTARIVEEQRQPDDPQLREDLQIACCGRPWACRR